MFCVKLFLNIHKRQSKAEIQDFKEQRNIVLSYCYSFMHTYIKKKSEKQESIHFHTTLTIAHRSSSELFKNYLNRTVLQLQTLISLRPLSRQLYFLFLQVVTLLGFMPQLTNYINPATYLKCYNVCSLIVSGLYYQIMLYVLKTVSTT